MMNREQLKRLLHSYKFIQFKIDAANDELGNLAAMIDTQRNVKSPILTGMPGSNEVSDPVANAAEKIIDIYCRECARIENELKELYKEKHYIDDMINCLNGVEKRIIELKYFNKYKWWMVAKSVNFSETQTRRMGTEALKIILLNCEKT